jgi:nicotinamidase-related amidase
MTIHELLKAVSTPRPPLKLARENTVLLLIDMQRLALSDYLVHEAEEKGLGRAEAKAACADYDARFERAVGQSKRLLEAFRERDMTPIHVRIESYAGDGRDVGPSHRRVGFIFPPGDPWAEFIEDVEPAPGEIVLSKTCSGAVIGSSLDNVLRHLNARYVVTVGFYTDQCVETTVRDLHDLGYDVTMVTDATDTATTERYDATMKTCVGVYCRGLTTDQVLSELRGIEPVRK